ncbi:MAG: penicillin-binding protein 2 [Acidobacteria bacterium]|nr:penicillin-binding protein 2 [Acidobacteriota bacterium]
MALKLSELNERARFSGLGTRLAVIQYILLAAFGVLAVRLYLLQVVDHKDYLRQAENNRIRTIPIPAPRGAILDREGRLIVDNRPSLSIILNREELRERGRNAIEVVDEMITEHVQLDRDAVLARLEDMKSQPLYYPIMIEENAKPEDVAWVRAHRWEFPELDILEQPQRRYPYGSALAHVIGYVGEINRGQLKRPEYAGYRPGDLIGKAGVEAVYDRLIRGQEGWKRVVVDSTGREISELERVDPVPGDDIRLTIDLDLQLVAESELNDRRGAIVALDPRSGEVLVMVSHPSFDPNLFSQRITTPEGKSEYRALVTDPERPMYNRVIQGVYPTGSTWKILIAAAGLEEGIITPGHSAILCGGGIKVGRFVRCMKNHGSPDIHAAIVHSCDGYFYRLGLKLGIDNMNKWVKRMGMGQKTGIDLPGERRGMIPSRELKAKLNPRDPRWKDFDTVLASIGQGSVVVTPIQLARAIAGVGSGGVFHTPHVFLRTERGAGKRVDYGDDKAVKIDFHPRTLETVQRGMWGVVNEGGTGGGARVEGFDVAGKTGTAQVVGLAKAKGHLKDHAWFVSFAPQGSPEIAAAILVENAGFGGTHSAPIARAVYEIYRAKHFPEGHRAAPRAHLVSAEAPAPETEPAAARPTSRTDGAGAAPAEVFAKGHP